MQEETYIVFNTTHTSISLSLLPELELQVFGNGFSKHRAKSFLFPVLIPSQTSVDLVKETGFSKKHLESCVELQRYIKGDRAGYLREISPIIEGSKEALEVKEIIEEFIAELKLPDEDPIIEDEIEEEIGAIDTDELLIEDEIEETLFEEVVEVLPEPGEEPEKEEEKKEEKPKKEKTKKRGRVGRPRKYDKKRGKK